MVGAAHSGQPGAGMGVYGISVTSELSGVPPQTLRLYERHGLLSPTRTEGGTRRYSEADLLRVQRITALTDAGINLAGVARILQLETDNDRLRTETTQLSAEKEEHQWSRTASNRRRGPPRPTSSNSTPPPTSTN